MENAIITPIFMANYCEISNNYLDNFFMSMSFAAEDLIKNARVQTIIWGPQTLTKVDHIAHLCHKNHIPFLTFSGISTTMCVFWLENHDVAFGDHDKIGFTLGSDNITFLSPKTNTRNARKLYTSKTKKICKGQTKLKIAVPQKEGFQVFVNVIGSISNKQNITGYSIDIFEAAIRNLRPLPCYEYFVFNGTYDELVDNVSLGVRLTPTHLHNFFTHIDLLTL